MRFTFGEGIQLHHAQGFGHARGNLIGWRFLHSQAKGHVFKNGHVREKRIALKNRIDVAVFSRNLGDVLVFEMDMAGIHVFQPGNQAQNRGFTTARGAKQCQEFAIIDGQVKIGNNIFSIKAFPNSRQMHQRRKRTRVCIQFFTLSHVDATDGLPLRGL